MANRSALLLLPSLAGLLLLACEQAEPTPEVEVPDAAADEPQPPAAAEPRLATIEKTGDPAIDALADFVAERRIDLAAANWRTSLPLPPKVEFAPDRTYYWNLTTSKGPIRIKLRPDAAPMHVSSTIYLTKLGFYDGLSFHRIIRNFMAQGGDPLGNGTGDPGYEFPGEFLVRCPRKECGKEYMGTTTKMIVGNEYFVCPHCEQASAPLLRHDRKGLLSWANSGPGTDGSQFFLTFKETPWLDGKHTIAGEVVDGMDTLDAIEAVGGGDDGTPAEPVVIERATIVVE